MGMATERNTRAAYIAGLARGWLQRGTHVLAIFRVWQGDGYREEHTCWPYYGIGSGMATERDTRAGVIYGFGSGVATQRNTRAGYIAGLAAGWLQRGTHVLGIFTGLAAG
jgi:hypothetical protein